MPKLPGNIKLPKLPKLAEWSKKKKVAVGVAAAGVVVAGAVVLSATSGPGANSYAGPNDTGIAAMLPGANDGATGEGGHFPVVELHHQAEATTVEPNYVGTLMPDTKFRGGDSYTIGYYVQDGQVQEDKSTLGSLPINDAGEVELDGQEIEAQGSGFTALALQARKGSGASVATVRNTTITAVDDEDGKNANDFVGLGTLLAASSETEGVTNRLNVDGSTLQSRGFCRNGVVAGSYSDAVITNSSITVEGADPLTEAYEGMHNTANQRYMIAPPWVLGISGGARATLVVGQSGSLTIADSVVNTCGWGCLSTDECYNPKVNAINTDLYVAHESEAEGLSGGSELFGYAKNYGTGYGSYAIGQANENFYGTVFHDVTYATIMTNCNELYYGPSKPGIELKNAQDQLVYTYEGTQERDTVVNGVWGLMDHDGGTATLDAGSQWNTEEATILKRGENISTFNITGAELNPKSGIILQMFDNDDGYGTSPTGGDANAPTYDGRTYNVPTFSGGWWEESGQVGLPSSYKGPAQGRYVTTTVNFENGSYQGSLYNGTGSGVGLGASGLQVNLGKDVTLTGAISASDTIHAIPYSARAAAYLDNLHQQYGENGINLQGGSAGPRGNGSFTVDYVLLNQAGEVVQDTSQAAWIQLTEFTMNEYYLLGHVTNFPVDGPPVDVILTDGATWEVTGDSHVKFLSIGEGCSVHVAKGATLYVAQRAFSNTDVPAGDYGEQTDIMTKDLVQQEFNATPPEDVVWFQPDGSVPPEGAVMPTALPTMGSSDGPPALPPGLEFESFDDATLDTSHTVQLWSKEDAA